MNYYNPYFMGIPGNLGGITSATKSGLFTKLLGGGFNLGSIISNTQKTLGVVNQAIPLIKQVHPIVKNAGTMFKVMNEFKKVDTPTPSKSTKNEQKTNTNNNAKQEKNQQQNINGPTFFL